MNIKIPVTTVEERPLLKGDVIESSSPYWEEFYNTLRDNYKVLASCYLSNRIEDLLEHGMPHNVESVTCIDTYHFANKFAFVVKTKHSREDIVFIVENANLKTYGNYS